MVKTWDKVAMWLEIIGIAMFALSAVLLTFGTGVVSQVVGIMCGVYSIALIASSIAATHEAIEVLDEEIWILEDEGL